MAGGKCCSLWFVLLPDLENMHETAFDGGLVAPSGASLSGVLPSDGVRTNVGVGVACLTAYLRCVGKTFQRAYSWLLDGQNHNWTGGGIEFFGGAEWKVV
jgi:hypothetical protein